MSTYNSARGLNVSQFLRDLQANPTQDPPQEEYVMDDDLSMFTNTHFFDLETGQNTDFQPQPIKPEAVEKAKTDEASPPQQVTPEFSELDVNFIPGDFNFTEFGNNYSSPTIQHFPDNLNNLQSVHPNSQPVYPAIQHSQQASYAHQQAARAGEKRKAENVRPVHFEEQSRMAAEEDKRRRNTAASARFRIKKKAREQALEKSAKEMNDKVTSLEGRIQQLETENKWLKNMVLEKNGGNEEYLSKLMDDLNGKTAQELKAHASKNKLAQPERKGVDLTSDMSG